MPSKNDKPEAIAPLGTLEDKPEEEFISTGIKELDDLVIGFPRGRITEIWGKEHVGKTHVATVMMASLSKTQKVLFVDAEYSLNKQRVRELGADPKNISYVADSRLERVADLLVREVGNFDVIIVDSLAALTPTTVEDGEMGAANIGIFARLVKQWALKMRPKLDASRTALVVLNQYRAPIGMYASEEPPGGAQWRHACDLRIKLTSNSGDKLVGSKWVKAEVKKNKVGKPDGTTRFKVMY